MKELNWEFHKDLTDFLEKKYELVVRGINIDPLEGTGWKEIKIIFHQEKGIFYSDWSVEGEEE